MTYTDPKVNWSQTGYLLRERSRFIIIVTLVAAVAAAVFAMLQPNIFTATSTIIPPQQNQSTASMVLGQLGSLVGSGGAGLGAKNASDLYVAILRSRTIADGLIDEFGLEGIYGVKTKTDARKVLSADSSVVAEKEGLISISVRNKNPEVASRIANGYVEQLFKLNQKLALNEASQRRSVYEGQLQAAKEHLADAEVALRRTQEETGLIQADNQAKVILESLALAQARVSAKEVQVQSMRTFATPQNPDLIAAETQLQALRQQVSALENNQSHVRGDIRVPTGSIPGAALEYVRRFREVKYHEMIFEILSKQYEAAKLDEAKTVSPIQIVDRAVPPEKKSGPMRTLMVLQYTLLAFVVAVSYVLIKGRAEWIRGY